MFFFVLSVYQWNALSQKIPHFSDELEARNRFRCIAGGVSEDFGCGEIKPDIEAEVWESRLEEPLKPLAIKDLK